MRYADNSRGRLFAKDPAVVRFNGRYFLYYTLPPYRDGRPDDGFGMGVAVSDDLDRWEKIGEIMPDPDSPHEANGICAPGAIVRDGRVHLFYQTYGNGPRDAICHAVSTDGLTFARDRTNPIFAPTGDWNNGRAIDADVIPFGDQLFLYFASRDPAGEIQLLGVATAPLASDWGRASWTQACDAPSLRPELPWEQECIEAPALCRRGDTLFMFYAGAYNNCPQQVGVARSADGLHWQRLADEPFLANGAPGTWHASESGHPFLFTDDDGRTHLFFQGNDDGGKTWHLARVEVGWRDDVPFLRDAPAP
jgi:predicted GH43/DUF377 family glycosyl hydrolase